MAVRIRLRRMGRKKQPHYRVVVADSAKPRDGRFVESLGYYRPLSNPARVVIDLEKVDYWIGQGAIPTDTVRSLIEKARKGGDDTMAVGEVDVEARKAKQAEELAARRKAEVDAAAAEAAAAKEAEAARKAEAAAAKEAEAKAAEAEAAEAAPEAEASEEAPEAKAEGEAEPDEAAPAEAEGEEEKGKES
jgi:small subunit ribosomal protein S16